MDQTPLRAPASRHAESYDWPHDDGRLPQVRLVGPEGHALDHDFDPRHVACARRMLRTRKIVAQHVPRNVSRDTFWDIAFELFVCCAEGKHPCVKQVIIASGETSTTALRHIDRLENAGLIERMPDKEDHRRSLIGFSAKGLTAMGAILESMVAACDGGDA